MHQHSIILLLLDSSNDNFKITVNTPYIHSGVQRAKKSQHAKCEVLAMTTIKISVFQDDTMVLTIIASVPKVY
jgi:hypothetical protein